MSDLIIRSVVDGDFKRWKPLWDGYNAFYGREGSTAIPDEITGIIWSRFLNEREPLHALVAERSGDLLGLAHYLFHASTTSVEPVCYLRDLFTTREARGQGIGTALIDSVCDKAKAAGAARVYWHTEESNSTARKLYDKIASYSGFVVYNKDL